MSNHSDWFCMVGVLQVMFFSCALQMSLFRWNASHLSSVCHLKNLCDLDTTTELSAKNQVDFYLY